MDICLSDALHLKWQHALYAPLRDEMCAGLEQVCDRDNNAALYKWEVKDETPFRCADAEVRTQVVVICDPTPYQLDHKGAPAERKQQEKGAHCN